MAKKNQSDEVDIFEFIQVLWKYKQKIFFIVSTFVFLTFIYQVSQKEPELKIFTTTEIQTISNSEENKYYIYNYYLVKLREDQKTKLTQDKKNQTTKKDIVKLSMDDSVKTDNLYKKDESEFLSLNFKTIKKSYLLDLFINQLNENEFIKSEIKKFNLIKRKDFNSIEDYNDAVNAMSLSFKLGLTTVDKTQNNNIFKPKIYFKTGDVSELKKFLKNLEKSTNEKVKNYLQDTFKDNILNFQTISKYQLEDIEMEIQNARNNYEKEVFNRVAFLKEQAAIARELEIPKSSNSLMESQTFSTQTGIITNLKSEVPYYMRGYEMIEKEIYLIVNRENKEAFNNSLLQLENKKSKILRNKDLERLQSLFEETPIKKSNEFVAANIMYDVMQESITQKESSNKNIFLSGIIGVIFAIFYVVIVNGIKRRN